MKGKKCRAAAVGGECDLSTQLWHKCDQQTDPAKERNYHSRSHHNTVQRHILPFTCHMRKAKTKVLSAALAECIWAWFCMWVMFKHRKQHEETLSLMFDCSLAICW